MIARLFNRARRTRPRAAPAVPIGVRVYAVGDIHGRFDLLDELLARIEADRAGYAGRAEIIFLGDYIDRGPHSAQVLDRLVAFAPAATTCRFLAGNHEAALVAVIDGDQGILTDWLEHGGLATLDSYGIGRREVAAGGIILNNALMRVPDTHRAFLATLVDHVVVGDYLFVHAGIRPGVPLARQQRCDLQLIRDGFLDDDTDHGVVVVHGHSISDGVDIRPNRIGIDTGAYRTGRLTALVLEGESRTFLQTGQRQ